MIDYSYSMEDWQVARDRLLKRLHNDQKGLLKKIFGHTCPVVRNLGIGSSASGSLRHR